MAAKVRRYPLSLWSVPLGAKGRPDVPAAHAGRHPRRRHGRHRHATRRAVPHGGEERTIRAGIIADDLLEAVIGVAPNLFYGTGIPACILVLRQQAQNGANRVSGKPAERQGKVLFINADREYFEGRAQNYLLPEHIEKIVTTFDEFKAVPGLGHRGQRHAERERLQHQHPPLRRQRPATRAARRARPSGGRNAKGRDRRQAALFAAHGLDPMDLFVARATPYVDFRPELASARI